MEKGYYNKTVICPVCEEDFNVTKVLSTATRVVKRDEDFCPYYEPINSLFYNALVCPNCGYAALEESFDKISSREIEAVKQKINTKWTPKDYTGIRSIEQAIEVFKIVLVNCHARGARSSEMAKVCMYIAWLYRITGDVREKDFLKFALTSYMTAFEKETLGNENLEELRCKYMIGELNRRLGEHNEAAKWYHKVIAHRDPNGQPNPKALNLINMAREQLQGLREELDNARHSEEG